MAGELDIITNFDSLLGRGGSPAFSRAFADIGQPDLSSALTGPTTFDPMTQIDWNSKAPISSFGSSLAPNPFRTSAVPGQTDGAAAAGGVTGAAGAAAGAVDPNRGLGLNIPTLQLGFGALNSIGNLYAAFQSNALAKKQFAFQKNAYNQNLTNSIQSYNTALADRARSRAVVEGQTDAQRDAYVSENSLKKTA